MKKNTVELIVMLLIVLLTPVFIKIMTGSVSIITILLSIFTFICWIWNYINDKNNN